MKSTESFASDVAFTDTVKSVQRSKGSRRTYERMERDGSWQTTITDELRDFISRQTSVFLATANLDGQPYIQHRGGPSGFLHVEGEKTIAFADYAGNRQYITTGNLSDNPKAQLFLIDYAHRQRVKVWGTAKVIADDQEFVRGLMPHDYRAKADQAIVFTVLAWDANCPQYIPVRYDESEVQALLAKKDQQIAALQAEIGVLRRARG